MAIATVGALVGIGFAYFKYIKNNQVPAEDSEITGVAKVLYNKYYVDEIYDAIIVNPLYRVSHFFRKYVETAVSGFVFGLGKITNEIGNQGKLVQNGSIGLYLFAFVLGVCSIFIYLFLV